MPSIEKQLLSIPMTTGLKQKSDARWLQPGAMLQVQNAVKLKAETFQKRPGFLPLNTTAPQLPLGDQQYQMKIGRRLGVRQGVLTAFADAFGLTATEQYPTMLWQYDEQQGAPIPYDMVPETAIAPGIPVYTFEQSAQEVDEVVANGLRITVGLVDLTGAGLPTPYYCIQDALTNEYIVPPQPSTRAGNYASPKIITVTLSGVTYALLCFMDASGPTQRIYGQSLSLANPLATWCALQTLITSSHAGMIFDLSAVAGDTTSFALAYSYNTSGAGTVGTIAVSRCNLTIASLPQVNQSVTISDTQYNTDSNPLLDGICVRADNTHGYVWAGYAYRYGGTSRRVRVAAQNWPNVTGVYSAPFSLEDLGNTQVVSLMAIERVGTFVTNAQGTINDVHMVAWSPRNQLMNGGLTVTEFTRTAHFNGITFQGLLNNQPRTTYNVTLGSRIVLANDRAYVGGYLNSSTQGGYVLLAIDYWTDIDTTTAYPLRLVGTIAPRLASGPPSVSGAFALHAVLPHVVANPNALGGNVFEWCVIQNKSPQISGAVVYQIDFSSPKNYANTELGGNLAIACGAPQGFDGDRCFELGYPYKPELLTTSFTVSGGQLPGGASLSYVAIYEQRDMFGQVHRSGRSPAVSVTTTNANGQVSVTVPTMTISGRQKATPTFIGTSDPLAQYPAPSPIIIRLYRTTNGGTTYYSCDASDQVSPTTVATYNVLSQGQVTLTDTNSDASLSTHPTLYGDGGLGTNGSSLDNLNAPSFQHIITHKNRLWGVDGSNVWYSKAFTTYEGSAFNESFAFSVDDGSGPVTALASLDDKLIIFKRTGIYYVLGDGPSDGGGQNDLTPPQKITSSVGCLDWRSVLVRSSGIMFWSARGQYILTRDLQVMPIPAVEDAISSNPAPTSAVLHPTASRLLWTANTDDTSNPRNGIGIAYDDVLDSWTTWQASPSNTIQGAVSAAVAYANTLGVPLPTYHWLRADGTIMRETPTNYLDASGFVGASYQTPWIKGSDILGFARFRRLYVEFLSPDPHDLFIYVSYDDEDTLRLLESYTWTQIRAFATAKPMLRVPLSRHRAKSVRFTIQDAVSSDSVFGSVTGQGMSLLAMTLEVGVYTNARGVRLPAAQAG